MKEALPTVGLALLLGFRHGLAPDHLAVIDGLTVKALLRRPGSAPWMGALFSIGHGMIMLLVVALSGLASSWFQPSAGTLEVLGMVEWLPGVFLLCMALLNAVNLLRAVGPGAASRPVPPRLQRLGDWGPMTALALGMLFALGLDSALQAVSWGYAATAAGGIGQAMFAALAFVLGMTATDTLDGYATAKISGAAGPGAIAKFRRRLGWPVVALCAFTGAQLIVAKACAACAPDDHLWEALGFAIIGAAVCMYLVTLVSTVRAIKYR